MKKIVIVGCGNVGMAYAYSIVSSKANVDELVLIDINAAKAEGEAQDLTHASACTNRRIVIKAGGYKDCGNADIVCIAAGKNQEVGETRTDLINKNYAVFKSIISEINKTAFKGIYLIATNPLDVMTHITYKLSHFPYTRVIGSGTTLDTARLRSIVGIKLGINPTNIHAYVIGEHGDTELVPWSSAIIGLNKATKYLDAPTRTQIADDVKNSAYDIIQKKGNTSYGIGMCLLNISNAILNDAKSIFTVSSYDSALDVYYGMPTLIDRAGAGEKIELELTAGEKRALDKSVAQIVKNVKSVNLD